MTRKRILYQTAGYNYREYEGGWGSYHKPLTWEDECPE